MVAKRRLSCLIIVFLIFLLPIIYAQQVVEVNPQTQPVKKGFLSNTFSFLKSPIFWYILIGFIIFIAILIGLFFFLRWLIKFFKTRNDIFWRLKVERTKLAKIQRSYPSKSWFRVKKNTPIRLVKTNNGKLQISQPIAYHRGDYVTHEGNVVICMNLRDNNKFFIFPITDLLIIPNKPKIEILRRNENGKNEKIIMDNLPQAKDIIQFNENEILIFAESFSNVGSSQVGFYVPVLKAEDGKIVDLSLPIYQSLREVIMGDYLYEQSDEFVRIAKKSMDINPHLRFEQKTSDTNQAVEVPQR